MVINVFHLNGAPAIPFNTKSTLKQSKNNKSQEAVKTFPTPSHCPVLLPWLIKAPWVMHFISWSVSAFQTCLNWTVDTKEPKTDTCSLQTDSGGRAVCTMTRWKKLLWWGLKFDYVWLTLQNEKSYFSFVLLISVNTWLDCVCLSVWKWCH